MILDKFRTVSSNTVTFGKLIGHYTKNHSKYMDLIKYRSTLFNCDGIKLNSGLYVKSPNLSDEIGLYDFYYSGEYLFSIRLSIDTGESCHIFFETGKKVYGDAIATLATPYSDTYYEGHPNYDDFVFYSLYVKCMDTLFKTTESTKTLIIETKKQQMIEIQENQKRKHATAYEKIKLFIGI